MNKKKIWLCAMAITMIAQLGKAQTFDPNVISDALNLYNGQFKGSGTARYIGMGESMGALGGDISAAETNPAGLGIFTTSVANFSVNVLSNKNTASMLNSYSNSDTNFNLTNAGMVFALGNEADIFKVNLGLNYNHQRLDNDVIFPENGNFTYKDSRGNNYIMDSYEQYTGGYKSKLNFTVGTNYEDRFYFGLGLSWNYLSMNRNEVYSDRNLTDNNVSYFNAQSTPYWQDANGFGLSVGAIGKITSELRVGLAYHSPIWWSDMRTDFEYYNVSADSKGNIGLDINHGYYDKYKNTAPGNLVASIAYASNISKDDNQSLAANFDFVNYFNKDYQFKGDSYYRLNNSFVDSYMQNSQEYRGGVEYRYKFLKLRAGYGYASSPVKKNTISGYDFAANQDNVFVKNYLAGATNKFSIGVGYDEGPFFVDFAYQYAKTDYYTSLSGYYYNTKDVINFGPNDDPYFDPIFGKGASPSLGKVKNIQNNFILTLGFRF